MKKRVSLFLCKLFKFVSLPITLLITIDVIAFGSIYRVLDYGYIIGSKLICLLPSSDCNISSQKHNHSIRGKDMVVTSQHLASDVGAKILQDGGNAIDAAVAVGYALAVTHPCCGNLGGGGFMTIRFANGKETFIDFRETAPLAATSTMYQDENGEIVKDSSTKGYLAVGVPGTVKGLNFALEKYGTMSRYLVISPAINLAKNGYELDQGDVNLFKAGKSKLEETEISNIFLDKGKLRQIGDTFKQPDLASTLEKLVEAEDAFYKGDIAHKIVAASQANGGILTLKDFSSYKVKESQPISCNYRNYKIISSPPPGGGTTLCQMLNILAGYDLKKSGWHTTESLHHILSSMLFAFGDRNTFLGDPDFVDNPLDRLLSQEYAAEIRAQIPTNKAVAPEDVYDQEVQNEGTNTTHYSVIDKQGNAVAVTYTINSFFGAGVVAPGTGFILNNEMDDFTVKVGVPNQFGLVQGEANSIEPGKRPLSSMSPTILTKDKKVVLITGTPGGSTIPTSVLQIITNFVDYKMNSQEAIHSPRFHYQGSPDVILTEPSALSSKTFIGLWRKGYKILPFFHWGAAESIYVDPETNIKTGLQDPRSSSAKSSTSTLLRTRK